MIQISLSLFLIIFYFLIINFIYDLSNQVTNIYKKNVYSIKYIYVSSIIIIVFLLLRDYFSLVSLMTAIPILGNIISFILFIGIFINLYYLQVLLENIKISPKFNKLTSFSQSIIKYYTNLSYIYLIGFSIVTYYMIL